jgi:hypothetical protein
MDSEMLAALPRAAADGQTLLAHHSRRPAGQAHTLTQQPGRDNAFGESALINGLRLPQPRRTHAVVGARAGRRWGLDHGLNEHGLAAGQVRYRSRLSAPAPLAGPDLVRLALERCAGALQAVELVGDLIARHGQGEAGPDGRAADCALLLADRREAFLLVAAGGHWAVQEARQVRAAGAACHVRADWDRVSRGLADLVISRGWWPEDGSKIDFEGTVGAGGDLAPALLRWGQTTRLLEEQNGRLDVGLLRRLLAELAGAAEGLLPHLPPPPPAVEWAGLVAWCGEVPVAWCSLGPADACVWLPLLPGGDLPAALTEADGLRRRAERLAALARCSDEAAAATRAGLAQIQHRLDNETRDFAADAAGQRGDAAGLRRRAGLFMEHALERYDDAARALLAEARPPRRPAGVPG